MSRQEMSLLSSERIAPSKQEEIASYRASKIICSQKRKGSRCNQLDLRCSTAYWVIISRMSSLTSKWNPDCTHICSLAAWRIKHLKLLQLRSSSVACRSSSKQPALSLKQRAGAKLKIHSMSRSIFLRKLRAKLLSKAKSLLLPKASSRNV